MNAPPWFSVLSTPVKTGATLLAGFFLVLIFSSVIRTCNRDDTPKLPPAIVSTVESLKVTKPEFERMQDSLRKMVTHDTVRVVVLERSKVASVALANDARRRADSLATLGTQYKDAYDARTAEANNLRTALSTSDSVVVYQRDALFSLGRAYGADTLRRIAVEKLNIGLQKAVADLEKPCTLVLGLKCPSRTVVGIASIGLGALAARKL